MSWLKEQFTLLGSFFQNGFRKTALLCAAGMLAAGVLGFAAAVFWPDRVMETVNDFIEYVLQSGVIDDEGQMSVFTLLMNNWRAMLVSALYGLIPFLFLSIISLMYNGALLGMMVGIYQANGMPVAALLAGLLPHGVFELPALILSIACGVRLCKNMCLIVTGSPNKTPFMTLAEDLLRILVLVIAPLTVVAAFIECYVTPVVMSWFL